MKPIPAKQKPSPTVGPQLSTGFPSPAEDYEEPPLDLHNLTVANPLATYFMRADTDDMHQVGIRRGDILVVDRSLPPDRDRIVIAIHDGAFHVMQCRFGPAGFTFSNDSHTITADPANIWGVVTYIVHKA